MKFTRSGSVQLMAGMIVGVGAIVVACGGDDSTGTTSGSSSGGQTSSSGGSSGTTSSSGNASSSGSTTTDAGGTDSGGTDGATDGGGDAGAKKANGVGPCASGAECTSGECFVGKKESYCSIKCDNPGDTDPKCEALGGDFSGDCNGQSYCKKD